MTGPRIEISGDVTSIGSNARLEFGRKRGESGELLDERCWYVYRLEDVSGDDSTTESTRWAEVSTHESRDEAVSAAYEFAAA